MNLIELRRQFGGLDNLTDDEIVRAFATVQGIDPDNTPGFDKMADEFKGYNRTAGQAVADTALGLGRGLLGIGELAGTLGGAVLPGVSAYDNPVANTFRGWSEAVGENVSPGMQARQADAQRRVDIARRQAEAEGAGFMGQVGAEAGAQAGAYWDNPSLLFQDAVTNAPQLLAGGVAGRGIQMGARALGAGAGASARAGVAGGVGTGAAMQGADVGGDTYERAIQAGASPEQATQLANQAALRAGGASVGLSLLPGGTAIERSLVRGAGPGRLGLGMAGRGIGEGVTEGLEEGYGRFAGNEAVQVVDPTTNLAGGVGSAAVQGAAVGGPIGAALRPSLPRTETGEINLTGTPPPQPQPDIRTDRSGPVEVTWDNNPPPSDPLPDTQSLDRPAYQRRGLDPMNERSSPWPEGTPPTMVDLAGPPLRQDPRTMADLYGQQLPLDPYTEWEQQAAARPLPQLPYNPTTFVDPTGYAQTGGLPNEQEMMARMYAPQPADPARPPAAQGPVPRLPYNPGIYVDPTGTAQVGGMPSEQDILARRYAPQPTDAAIAAENLASELAAASAEVGANYTKKDGTLTKTARDAVFAKILRAEDPIAAIREAHQGGASRGARDEVLDALHRRLTGQTVFDWVAANEVNSAGFVSEPTTQLQAQAQALREGRKPAMVLGMEDVNRVNLTGVPQTIVTDPRTRERAVVASPDPALLTQAQERVNQVGLRQAMGEIQGLANPTLTANPAPGSQTVQQVDNQTGEVIQEEVITEADIPNVRQVPGTTARVVPNEQVIGDRVADQPATAPEPPAAPRQQAQPRQGKKAKAPNFGRMSSERLIQLAENRADSQRDDALYELYKRWYTDSDGGVAATYLTANPLTEAENARAEARFAPEKAELERKAAEREEKEGQRRGRQFGASFRATSEITGKPLTAAELRKMLDDIKKDVPAAAAIEIAASPESLGLTVPDGRVADGVTMPDGRIYLFTGALANRLEVERTVFHELVHRGLRVSMDRQQYNRTMANIAARDPRVFQYANQWKAGSIGQQTRDMMADGRPLTGERLAHYEAIAVDEALARVAEELAADRLPGSKRGVVRNLAAWLGNVADTLGLKNLAQWLRRQTYNEQEKFVLDAIRRAADPGPTTPPPDGPQFRTREGTGGTNATNAITAPFQQVAQAQDADIRSRSLSENLLKVLSLRQINEQYGKYLPAFGRWMEAVFERSSKASRIASRADRVALQWERQVKNKAHREALADILLRASVAELSLDNTSPEYLNSLDATQRAEHAALRSKLQSLPPEVQRIRSEALQILEDQWTYTRAALENFIEHTISDPDLRAERIKDLRSEFGKRRGDYFPLSRFGDTIVIARGAAADGRDTVQFFEKESDAVAEVKRLRQAGVKQVNITKRTDRNFRERASTGFMNDLHRSIDQAEMSPEARNALHESLQQLFLKSLPEVSGAKHMIRRENIEGYSTNALRVFADAVTKGSRYASHLEFAPQVQAAMESAETQSRSSDMRQAAVVIGTKEGSAPVVQVVPMGIDRLAAFDKMKADGYTVRFFNTTPETARESLAAQLPEAADTDLDRYLAQIGDVVGRTESGIEDLRSAKTLYNFMVDHQRREAEPETLMTKAVDTAGQVGYAWFLGFTPAFWLTNILQNPMVGIPHLGAKYGVGRSASEWGRAMTWFGNVRMGKLWNDHTTPFSVEWLTKAVADQKIKGISQAELKMLQRLEDRQVLDFTQSMDLARVGQASGGAWNKAMRLAAAGAHHTEVFNRVSFALAAYRLALKSNPNVTHEQAVQMAENDVAAAHFDYSGTNKPELMQGKARLIFMFQQYRQHMLYWWAKQVKDAIGKDASPEDRRRAGKAMLLMATAQGTFAGALGLPFIGSIGFVANLIGAAFGDDDDPFDFERWLKEGAEEQFGTDGAEVFTKGIFASMRMNISQRIGQADLLPFLNEGSARFERNRDDKVRAYLFDLAGPMGSIALGAARSVDDFARGDVLAGIADASPKFAADAAKALQMHIERIKDSRGDVLATGEAFDGWDVALQATGVVPTSAARIRDWRGRVLDIENHYIERGKNLRAMFVEAWSRQDRDGMADALESIQKFNQRLAEKYRSPQAMQFFGITKDKLAAAARDHRQREIIRVWTNGTAETKRQMMLALQMSGVMAAPQPTADPTWDAGWN